MSPGELYRIEHRLQNKINKYYLIRQIFSDAKRFSASRLIKSGTPPTRTEINRCASMYGFELELRCVQKAAKFRTGHFTFDVIDDSDAVFELERYRCLFARKQELVRDSYYPAYIAASTGVTLSASELEKLFSAGTLPRGKTLADINRAQNIYNAIRQRTAGPLTVSQIYKIHLILNANSDERPLSPAYRTDIAALLKTFYRKIKCGYYPFEQCVLFASAFEDLVPDSVLLTTELYSRMAGQAGYIFYPTTDTRWEAAVKYAKETNPLLELDIRELNTERCRVRSGGRQKQLDLSE